MSTQDPASRRLLLAELKAKCGDLTAVRARLRPGADYEATVRQVDTYFPAPGGRLKLREVTGRLGQLIYYERPDVPVAKASQVQLADVEGSSALGALLAAALGVQARVAKTREVWNWEGVRIHLDTVEGLGTFVELEEIADGPDALRQALSHVRRMMADLGLRESDLVDRSYGDLAASTAPRRPPGMLAVPAPLDG
jgi:adenylate cyclase, class 2